MERSRLFIAIVDDEESVRKALRRLLAAHDMETEGFASGQGFLDSLAAQRPDCVVLDLHMPGLTGADVLQRLALSGLELPAIVITAHDDAGSQACCLAAGAAAYLRKPLDETTLLEAIRRAVGTT